MEGKGEGTSASRRTGIKNMKRDDGRNWINGRKG
jgi:hypothetical protein